MKNKCIVLIVDILLVLLYTPAIYGQNEQKISLSKVLDSLELKYNIVISYQPKVCDKIHISPPSYRQDLQDVLDEIEKGSKMQIGIIDSSHYYVHARKQQYYTITGKIIDADTGEPLIGAEIKSENIIKSISGPYGVYSFVSGAGIITLEISYPGYKVLYKSLNITKGGIYNWELFPLIQNLQEIVVTENVRTSSCFSDAGKVQIFLPNDESVASRMGKNNALSILESMPGITPGNVGTGEIFVRGGDQGSNGFYIDGAPVYSVNHLYGVNSVFNTNAIDKIEMYKGCIPSRYGDYTGSVTEFFLKNGNLRNRSVEFTFGNFMSEVLLQGPIKHDTASYFVSMRYAYPKLYASLLPSSNYAKFTFSDFYAKFNLITKKSSRLFFSCFYAQDKTHFQRDNEKEASSAMSERFIERNIKLRRVNLMLSIRWNKILSEKFFFNITAYHSQYGYKALEMQRRNILNPAHNDINILGNAQFKSSVMDNGMSFDLRYFPAFTHQIRSGISISNKDMCPYDYRFELDLQPAFLGKIGLPNELFNYIGSFREKTMNTSLYVEDEVAFGDKWTFLFGMRGTYLKTNNRKIIRLLPFLQFKNELSQNVSLSCGYYSTMQTLRLQPATTVLYSFASSLWFPAAKNMSPEYDHLIDASITLRNHYFRASGSVYFRYKANSTLWNLNQRSDGAFYRDIFFLGKGIAWGGELLLQSTIENWFIQAAYSLGYSKDKSIMYYNNTWHQASNDIRHAIDLSLNRFFCSGKYEVAGIWSFRSGSPYTQVQERQVIDNNGRLLIVDDYSYRNNSRFTNTHYLNINFNYHYKIHNKMLATISIGLYNLYYRKNPFYAKKEKDEKIIYKEVSIAPIIPYFAFTIKI